MNEDKNTLELISRILWRSFLMSIAILLLWLVIYFAIGDFWFESHSKMFNLTEHDLSVINYNGMLVFKMFAVCFLFCPFVAIKTVIHANKKIQG